MFVHDNFQLIVDCASYVAVPGNAQEVIQVEPEPTPVHLSWRQRTLGLFTNVSLRIA